MLDRPPVRRRFVAVAVALVASTAVAVVAACAPLPQSTAVSTTTTSFAFRRPQGPFVGPSVPATGLVPFHVTGNFCADLAQLQTAPSVSGADPVASFRAMDELKNEAPPDLQDVFDLITTAIADLGSTNANDPSAVQRALTELSDPSFQAGMQRLGTYAQNTCGVTLSGLPTESSGVVSAG
jgi:hypothetical protein